MKKLENIAWTFYINEDEVHKLKTDKCGKWMYFFDGSEKSINFVKRICEQMVREGIAIETKHTSETKLMFRPSGVCCFYCDGSDIEAHKKIISFMIENNMIQRRKTGKLYNLSFKYDTQTSNNEYGTEFESKIKLEDFIDLETGEWLPNINLKN